jgi:hypothetical protein
VRTAICLRTYRGTVVIIACDGLWFRYVVAWSIVDGTGVSLRLTVEGFVSVFFFFFRDCYVLGALLSEEDYKLQLPHTRYNIMLQPCAVKTTVCKYFGDVVSWC